MGILYTRQDKLESTKEIFKNTPHEDIWRVIVRFTKEVLAEKPQIEVKLCVIHDWFVRVYYRYFDGEYYTDNFAMEKLEILELIESWL